MIWLGIGVVSVGAYLLKLAGITVLDVNRLPPAVAELARLLPVALFAGLVVVSTLADGQNVVIDARVGGLLAAGFAAAKKAPFLVVVVAAMAVTATIRWIS